MEYYTKKQAAKYTGTSVSSIRRFFEPIQDDEQHDLRSKIRPSIEEVRKLKRNNKPFTWEYSDEVLHAYMNAKGYQWPAQENQASDERRSDGNARSGENNSTLALLERTVELLSMQLEKKDHIIDDLLDRLDTSQKQTLLVQGVAQERNDAVDVHIDAEEGSRASENRANAVVSAEVVESTKRGWFRDMLHKERRMPWKN